MANAEIYEKVTATILEALDKGVVPWRRPWRNVPGQTNLHTNLISKKAYRGVNQWLLELTAASQGYSAPYWLSFKQAKEKGGQVRKGEKGTMVVFWKIMRHPTDEVDSKGRKVVKTVPLLRFYYVFNVEQCDGVEAPAPIEQPEFDPIEAAQTVVDEMPKRPTLRHGGNSAHYSPVLDYVQLPEPTSFKGPEHYHSTMFHELAHSTGHKERLGRVKEWTTFGSDPYAKEELVAEMTAAMLCGVVGINTTHDQSASYIANWSKKIKEDDHLIISAAAQAQRAADFILGVTYENGES